MGQLRLALDHIEPFDAAIDEPLLYHSPHLPGFTVIRTGGTRQRQTPVRLNELSQRLAEARSLGVDTYIAQNQFFKPDRKVIHCWRLTSMYVDLDTYKLASLYQQPAEALADRLLLTCDDQGIPPPSAVVFSGRGLQAKWVLEDPLPQSALPRWQALQNELASRLEGMGADVKALDAARVLRLVGTVSSRSGQHVRVVHLQRTPTLGGALDEHGVSTYPFEVLFDTVMPVSRLQLQAQRRAIEDQLVAAAGQREIDARRRQARRQALVVVDGVRSKSTARALIPSQLAWDRLHDLRKLAEMRGFQGGLPSGQRNTFVFLGACFLAVALVAPAFRTEVHALAREFAPQWSEGELRACLCSVRSRLEAAARGETVEFGGQQVDPRYRFSNSTLVDWLGISSEEMPLMQTIITSDERRRRDRVRKEAQRRSDGCPTLRELQNSRDELRTRVVALRDQGKSWRSIASTLGISQTSARRYATKAPQSDD
jgi:hypothetical protein